MTASWFLWLDVFLHGDIRAQLPRQIVPVPEALFSHGWSLAAEGSYYTICLIALGVVLIGVALLQRSRLGRSMIAVRDNERAAASLGISPTRVKLTAFGIGGWIAGLAGGLLVGLLTAAAPGDFPATESLRVISIVVIGGLSSVGGAVLGAFFVVGLPELFNNSVQIGLLTSGAGMLDPPPLLPRRTRAGALQRPRRRVRLPRPTDARRPPAGDRASDAAGAAQPHPTRGPIRARGRARGVTDLSVSFGSRLVVIDVNLFVRPGEVVGLIGANGAGKSTLMNAVGGYVRSRGRVEILGHDVRHLSPTKRARLGLGRSFQGAELFQDLTVRETVGLAVPGVRPWRRGTRSEADEVLTFLGLGSFADRFINELSTGTRRVVELACLMTSGANVLCLDEPTAGIAQRESEAFGPLILRIRAELQASLLIIEHDMPVIMGISDRVYCLEAGRMLSEGPPDVVRNDPLVIASYLGTDERAIHRSGAAPVE